MGVVLRNLPRARVPGGHKTLDTDPGTSESFRTDPVSKTSKTVSLTRGVQTLLFYDDIRIEGLLPSRSTSVRVLSVRRGRLLFG
jgi:hypothetical protein